MNKWAYLWIGGAVGAAVAAVYNYLYAPAPETKFDGTYQSRLDWAVAEGDRAAAAREIELRAEYEAAIQPPPQLPVSPVTPPSSDLPVDSGA